MQMDEGGKGTGSCEAGRREQWRSENKQGGFDDLEDTAEQALVNCGLGTIGSPLSFLLQPAEIVEYISIVN